MNGRCKLHGGRATGPRSSEGRAKALANLALGRLPRAEGTRKGDPILLTDEVRERIVAELRGGATLAAAARAAGVGSSTAREWLARGERKHHRSAGSWYVRFAREASAARAESYLRRLRALVDGDTFERVLAVLSAPALSEAA